MVALGNERFEFNDDNDDDVVNDNDINDDDDNDDKLLTLMGHWVTLA